MNVFEDLIVELKEANLLESTVIEGTDDGQGPAENATGSRPSQEPPRAGEAAPSSGPQTAQKTQNSAAIFKKKAIAEVSSLQMVEHVITGVEREYLKLVPHSFDDLNAKKALSILVSSEDLSPGERKAAEVELMNETEAWCSALAERDRSVAVALLRQYCERSRPALSSQALLALGRFYRNLPYSEAVRSKFDFIMTRLFSRPVGAEKRICLFDRSEMLGHINTLYSDWSSISLYSVDDDGSNVGLTAMSFDELALEAESASSFDELIESDFFGRLRMFKESINDIFYAPNVTCAAIAANIRIGNAYVDLIDREREKSDLSTLHTKYSMHDHQISDTTGKTLQLAKLLKQLDATTAVAPVVTTSQRVLKGPRPQSPKPILDNARSEVPPAEPALEGGTLSVNKWVLIGVAAMIVVAGVLYIWSSYST